MKRSQFILAAAFFAASGLLQAAGAIKMYWIEASFAPDDAVDWIGLGAIPRDQNSRQFPPASSVATNATGSVVVGVATGIQPSPNSSSDERLPNTDANPDRFTITFTSGPVMGVGVRIQANGAGRFNGRMSAYDAAGNLLGTATVRGTATAGMADNAPPFIGMRSSLKEIAKVDIDSSIAPGFTIDGLRLGLHPIIENDLVFVNQQYQDLYGRAPSTAELTGQLNALKEGTSTHAQVAASLFQSSEFHDNAGFLVKCYLLLIERDADFVQWSQILKLMQGGATQYDALIAFTSLPEYAAAYPQGLSDGAFVSKLHWNLLGRDATSDELDAWASKFEQGDSRRDMVNLFLRSPEFEVRIAGRVDTSLAYLAFLRRGAEPAAMDRGTDKLNSGASVTDLIGDLISLPEYIARF